MLVRACGRPPGDNTNGAVIRPVGAIDLSRVRTHTTGAANHRCAVEQLAFEATEADIRWSRHHSC